MTRASTKLSTIYRRYLTAINLFHQAAADSAGLTSTSYQACNLLDLDGPLTSGELAQRMRMSTGATTRLVDRLIAAGVAERRPSPDDRRQVLIHSTGRLPDGLEATIDNVREPIGQALSRLTPEQLEGVEIYLTAAAEAYAEGAQNLPAPRT